MATITYRKSRRAADPALAAVEQSESDARRALRRAAVAYAEVAADDDEDRYQVEWTRLRDAALTYATATHDATRARAKEAK